MDAARHVLDEIIVYADPAEIEAEVHRGDHQKKTKAVNELTPLVPLSPLALDGTTLDVDLQSLMCEDRSASVKRVAIEEATTLVKLSLPMMASLVSSTVSLVIVSMMFGNVGTASESAVLIAANGLSDLFGSQVTDILLLGISGAVDTMCAQSVGAQAYRQLWLYLQAGLLASMYCTPLIVVLSLSSASIFTSLGQPSELAATAAVIIQVGLVSIPFQIVVNAATSALMSQGRTTPIFIANTVSYAISIPLGYLLGFSLGFGYVCLVISTVVNSIVQAAILGYAVTTIQVLIASWPGWQLHEAHHIVRSKAFLGFSCMLMITCQSFGLNSVMLMSGIVSNATEALSSSGIASALMSLTFMPIGAMYAVGAVRIGVALGAGKGRRAAIVSRVVVAMCVSLSLVGLIFCWAAAAPFSRQYTSDPAIAEAATSLIYTLLPLVPVVGVTLGATAVFQACGKQLLAAKLNCVFVIVGGISLGVTLAQLTDLGISGLWYGHMFGMAGVGIAATVWMYRLDWKTAAHEAYRNAHSHVSRNELGVEASTESESGYST